MLTITPKISTPSTVPTTVPRPPLNRVPPTTTAAIASSSSSTPVPAAADRARAAGGQERRQAGQDAQDHEDADLHAVDVDGRVPRRPLVGAHRDDVPARTACGSTRTSRSPRRPGRSGSASRPSAAASDPGSAVPGSVPGTASPPLASRPRKSPPAYRASPLSASHSATLRYAASPPQRRHERRHPALGHQQPVQQPPPPPRPAGAAPNPASVAVTSPRAHGRVGRDDAHDAQRRHERADGKVDAAGDDDERHADRDDADVALGVQDVAQVLGLEEGPTARSRTPRSPRPRRPARSTPPAAHAHGGRSAMPPPPPQGSIRRPRSASWSEGSDAHAGRGSPGRAGVTGTGGGQRLRRRGGDGGDRVHVPGVEVVRRLRQRAGAAW